VSLFKFHLEKNEGLKAVTAMNIVLKVKKLIIKSSIILNEF
jgi:hypothetical protein